MISQYYGNLTISAGLRYTLQKYAERFWFDLAPRAGIAWTPGGSNTHVARVAMGVFHSRISPDITLDTLRYDGVAVQEFFVDRPSFFPEIPPDFDATLARPTVRLKDDIRSPLTASAAASYEWQATKTFFASVGYSYSDGRRLLRSRNINVPHPVDRTAAVSGPRSSAAVRINGALKDARAPRDGKTRACAGVGVRHLYSP